MILGLLLLAQPQLDAAAQLLRELPRDADLAVIAPADWGPRLAGLVESSGRPVPRILPPNATNLEAILQGAEWSLVLTDNAVELRRIDRGLWEPAEFTVWGKVSLPQVEPSDPPKPPPRWSLGQAQRVTRLPERALAAASCGGGLVVLTAEKLIWLDLKGSPKDSLALQTLPRSPKPLRLPLGVVICEGGRVAFWHHQLATGFEGRNRWGQLAAENPLAGVPVGLDRQGWILAQVDDQGVLTHPNAPGSWWSLRFQERWSGVNAQGLAQPFGIRSGVGGTSYSQNGATWQLLTTLERNQDTLVWLDPEGQIRERRPFQHPIVASALDAQHAWVLTYATETVVWRLPLVVAP